MKGAFVGIVRVILVKHKGGIGRWKLTEVEERILVEIVGVVACASRIVKNRLGR